MSNETQPAHNGFHLREAIEALGGSLKDWTVMGEGSDPFRMDTPVNHRDGEWLGDTLARLGVTQRIHDRGLHYALLGQPTPKGKGGTPLVIAKRQYPTYANTDACWEWLQDTIGKARWLGYVDWDQIRDQRNAAPEVIGWTPPQLEPYVAVDFEVYLPDADDLAPTAKIDGFIGAQPYHIVMVGEKASLRDVLAPIATEHGADLYLPSGDISNTMVLSDGEGGCRGRPADGGAVLLGFRSVAAGTCRSVTARKLQAFEATLFPELDFRGVSGRTDTRPGAQARAAQSSRSSRPIVRAAKWKAATGTEQTEIDALATLAPDLLRDDGPRRHQPVLRLHPGRAGPAGPSGVAGGGPGSHRRAGRRRPRPAA